ncbi:MULTISPECIES: hypothetical protein [unclassified Colwellia]|uniref:hypothetical protein n=1 Tax=unclassified Colwellia TaxID=196834 RepID=UPI0015F4CA66|nr:MULTISPECIES: hypothetical protein [unclassified Colwellia]MBA6222753.1 hypothetical protein [Colwellia sp. MB3u-45]MBA6266040.1 hypothetical protein [Colwellia sp. MB3u-43]MBA6288907.1 hypothetical protein [Colwellia sp. MB3u-4]MBA6320480.1 hypothetical protein [Colwellia sp. MB02u-19]MBA6323367.1 hypothetical protein [Colwellia sp. MB02u-18]
MSDMRTCERCSDSYFYNYYSDNSGMLWKYCHSCRRSLLDQEDRQNQSRLNAQFRYAYGWGYNIDFEVATYRYVLNEDGSLTYSCKPDYGYDSRIRDLIIQGFLARLKDVGIIGATSQYMLDMAYNAGADGNCHDSFSIRHESKEFVFFFTAYPKVHFVFNDAGDVISMIYPPFQDADMKAAYGRGCADYIKLNAEACHALAEQHQKEALLAKTAEKIREQYWVHEDAIKYFTRLKYVIYVPWTAIYFMALAGVVSTLSYDVSQGWWPEAWRAIQKIFFFIITYFAMTMPSNIINSWIKDANNDLTLKKQEALLAINAEGKYVDFDHLDELFPMPLDEEINAKKENKTLVLVRDIAIIFGGLEIAVYIYDEYVSPFVF